jgi:carboxylate-amine ligase
VAAPFDSVDARAQQLRSVFDAPEPLTVGLEEEVMLLDPETLDLSPSAAKALELLGGDARFKPELPASQLEILTEPHPTVPESMARLAEGRRDLLEALDGIVRPAVAAVHPFAAPEGELSAGESYAQTRKEYGPIARRQLVTALQVHVAVGGAERTLAVYNALRSHLPDIAALAANGAFYAGRDSGMASVRPQIAELLPRQGLPPPIASWEEFAAELQWGAATGLVAKPRFWWWELRPHAQFGTLEVRVPDAQTRLVDAAAIAAVAQALIAWLAARHDAGDPLPVAPTWRIEENRWSAARHGVEGEMADLESGERRPTGERLRRLLDEIEPFAAQLGSAAPFEDARRLLKENGAIRQRAVVEESGIGGLAAWMADQFVVEAPRLDENG